MKLPSRVLALGSGLLVFSVLAGNCVRGQSENHAAAAEELLRARPKTSPEMAKSIRAGIVVVGMTPEEAHVTGGAGPYHIQNDPKWPPGTNPLVILAAQTETPDNSKIEMFFLNRRQYATPDPTHFTAVFELGRVVRIERGKPGA